jgi:nitrogen fixation/metabolism regulation signal transduction histidine kinase
MGFRSRFGFGLGVRLALLLVAVFAFVQTLYMPHLGAARLVAALLALGAAAMLWRYINSTNRELTRFIDAVRFGDLSQGFAHRFEGSGFSELGQALDDGIRKLREERHRLSDTNRFYESVLDDTPIALLTIEADGRVELANKAARRLLIRHQGVRAEDFEIYGSAFPKVLQGEIGPPRLVPLTTDALPQTQW